MQNSIIEYTELSLWKVATFLIRRMFILRWLFRGIINVGQFISDLLNDLFDGNLKSFYLYIIILLGGIAFGTGYLIAVLAG